MNKPLTLGSLFDGSGGFPLAGLLAGIVPVWSSEIEPFAIRVTEKRLPQVQHFGNISGLHGAKLPPVDIITFGSPCQDMSIAGKRTGLNGSRSSLFHEAIRIIREMRCASNGKYPRYIVWENVPGAFSSNGGEDFRCVLEAICSVKDSSISIPRPAGKWTKAGEILAESYSLAWRVLDAQYWGVPQRRKRIFLVADFDGTSAGKILFESEGLSGYSAESLRAWQRAAGSAADSFGTAGLCLCDQGGERIDILKERTATLRAEAHHPPCVLENHPADSRLQISESGKVQTLTSRCGTGGGNVPLLMDTPKTLKIRCGKSRRWKRQSDTGKTNLLRCPATMTRLYFSRKHTASVPFPAMPCFPVIRTAAFMRQTLPVLWTPATSHQQKTKAVLLCWKVMLCRVP